MKIIKDKYSVSEFFQDVLLRSLLVAGALLLLAVHFSSREKSETILRQQEMSVNHGPTDLNRVNYHLKADAEEVRMRELRAVMENDGAVTHIGLKRPHNLEELNMGRYLRNQKADPGATAVTELLDRERKAAPKSVRDEIENNIAEDQYYIDYNQKVEKEYVDVFIKNMQESGYEVMLNDKLEVVGVRKIRTQDTLSFF